MSDKLFRNNPWKPVLLYLIFGALWIGFSDYILSVLVTNIDAYDQIQTLKGWLFILITGFLLYLSIKRDNKIIYSLNEELTVANDELKEQRSLVDEIYQQSNAAIMIWSTDGVIVECNDYFCELFGYSSEELIGKNYVEMLILPENKSMFYDFIERLKEKKRSFNSEEKHLTRSGDIIYVAWNDAVLDISRNDLPVIASYGFDLTLEKKQAQEIYELAYIDSLTRLDNAAVYKKDIKRLQETGTPFTVYLIDIDNFKHLNEVHGHAYGDELLIKYAEILKSSLIYHHVYRWSGDQFIILEETTNPQAIQLTIDNIQSLSHKDWDLNGTIFYSTVSIGVTQFPDDTNVLADLYRNAEIALYDAKENGKACYQFYHRQMLQEIEYVNFVEHELNAAIENNTLSLFFQPIYSLKTNAITSYEVLLRWFNDNLKSNNIGKIIEIAEKTEQIINIDKWVIHNSFVVMNDYFKDDDSCVFAINLSVQSFKSSDFIDYLVEETKRHQIKPERIKLEITEHSIIQDLEYSAELMHRLKSHDFKLSLDDFGTRYSSLNYLSKLPFDILKLDKSYIDYLLLDQNDHAIIEMLVQLSKKLNLSVVAEGIEEQEQYDELLKLGCDYGQGYLMSKPFDLETLIRSSKKN